MRTKFKAWAEPFLNEHPEVQIDLEGIKKMDQFYLEIGSGKGEFLVKMALNNPDKIFIGVERNITCCGFIAKKLVEEKLPNVFLIHADFARIFDYFNDNSIETIFLNFSDPWPKKKHHKRRLTSTLFLEQYRRILTKHGKVIFKTDDNELFNDSIETFNENKWNILSITNDYDGTDPFDFQTEYEEFFRNEGTKINRVVLEK